MRTAFAAVIFMLFGSVYFGLPVDDGASAAVQVVTGIGEKKCTDSDVVSKQGLKNGGQCYFNSFSDLDSGLEDPQTHMKKKKKKTYKYVRKALQKQKYCMEENWSAGEAKRFSIAGGYKEDVTFCVPNMGDPTCKSAGLAQAACRIPSEESDAGCIIKDGCLEPAAEVVPPGVGDWRLNGDWAGDPVGPLTAGVVAVEDRGLGIFPPPSSQDLYYSITGVYLPEERFSYIDGTFSSGINAGQPRKGVPRDDILRLSAECAGNIINPLTDIRFRENGGKVTVGTIQCLLNDYIDDVDDFCNDFAPGVGFETPSSKKPAMYVKQVWKWDGGCWRAEEQPRAFQERLDDPNEKWMPLAREVELTGIGTLPVETDPYSNRYRDLGEYGYLHYKIFRDDFPYNKKNIYNLKDTPTAEQILSLNFMGIKRKKAECVKLFIEEWAHRGDCGEIVLAGASPDVDVSHCQWVGMYDSSDNVSLLARANAAIVDITRGMRSEHYDYENFNRSGYIPNMLSRTDICSLDLIKGNGERFWALNGLDFSKRGCPTVSGPDLWPGTPLNMKGCARSKGAPILDTDYWGLYTGPLARSFLLTADIEKELLVIQLSIVWGLATGGAVGVPVVIIPEVGKIDDWIDYSWTAASCTHVFNSAGTNDYWNETPDYSITSDCKSLNCQVKGFQMRAGSSGTVYDYKLNLSQFGSPAFWCDFEVPYYPFESGTSRMTDTMNPLDLMNPKGGALKTNMKMVERIRNGCGAFSHRGTWDYDRNTQLTQWLIGQERGRCEGWDGLFGRENQDLKIVSWRLPRFNYEFMKAFIECTGPVRSPVKVCGSTNWIRIAYNCVPKTYGGCGCCYKLDDATEPDYQGGGALLDGIIGGFGNSVADGDRPGFWCRCKSQNWLTTRCDETFCTCDQYEVDDAWEPTFCQEYGPFKRWLQCYYQARAKACPVLTREVSYGIVPGTLMVTQDKDAEYENYVNSHSVQRSESVPVYVEPVPVVEEPENTEDLGDPNDPSNSVGDLKDVALQQGIDGLNDAKTSLIDNLNDIRTRINADIATVQTEKDGYLQEQIDLPVDNTARNAQNTALNAQNTTLAGEVATEITARDAVQANIDANDVTIAGHSSTIVSANTNILLTQSVIDAGPAAIAAQQAIIDNVASTAAQVTAATSQIATINGNVTTATASRDASVTSKATATTARSTLITTNSGLQTTVNGHNSTISAKNILINSNDTIIAANITVITSNNARIAALPALIAETDTDLTNLNSDLSKVNGWITTVNSQDVSATTEAQLLSSGANSGLAFKGVFDAAAATSLYNYTNNTFDIAIEDKYDNGLDTGPSDVLGALESLEDAIETINDLNAL